MYLSIYLLILHAKFSLLLCITANVQWCKQITTATSSTGVVDADSWEEYVTLACQISTLSKRCPNGDYGVSPSFAFTVSKTQGRHSYWKLWFLTILQDRSSGCRIWRYGKRSFPSMRSASFLGSFASGCCCRVAICKSLMITVEPWTSIIMMKSSV